MANELAERLQRLMEERRISGKALSEQAGLSSTYIKDILRGRSRSPRRVHLAQIARVLGISVDALLDEPPRLPAHLSRPAHLPEAISDRLRAVLQTMEVSEAEFAARIDAPLAQLREWLAGTKEPGSDAMKRLCGLSGLTMDWLYLGKWESLWPAHRVQLLHAMYGADRPDEPGQRSSSLSAASSHEPMAAAAHHRRD